ncbi:hypothetical protein D3C72_2166500 [compost metagenome]
MHQAFGPHVALAEILLAAVALADANTLLCIGQDAFSAGPGFLLGGPQDRPQRQAEANVLLTPMASGGLAHLGDAFAHLLQRLAPHHVDVGMLGRDFYRGV